LHNCLHNLAAFVWLGQNGRTLEALRDGSLFHGCSKDKRDTTSAKQVGYIKDACPVQAHIEYGAIKPAALLVADQLQRIKRRRCWTKDGRSQRTKVATQVRCKQIVIFNNDDALAIQLYLFV
jgi:hypothetical protein